MKVIVGTVAFLLLAGAVRAASPNDKCEATKLKAAATYARCRLVVQSKEVKTGMVGRGDFTKCDNAFNKKWAAAETRGKMQCPTNGDASLVMGNLTALTASVGFGLGPSGLVDNGDGTITDYANSLMWEKKVLGECVSTPSPGFPIACVNDGDCTGNGGGGTCLPCLHCVNALYTWSGTGTAPDGTAFTEFLGQLNNCASDGTSDGFAGHCDWRLPTGPEIGTWKDASPCDPPPGMSCMKPAFVPFGYVCDTCNPSSDPYFYWRVESGPTSGSQYGYTQYGGLLSRYLPKTNGGLVRAVRHL